MAKPIIEWHDRYSATGRPRPNPKTVCKGKCEGMGFYPTPCARLAVCPDPAEHQREDWDGWHFVKCKECDGSGLRKAASGGEFGP